MTPTQRRKVFNLRSVTSVLYIGFLGFCLYILLRPSIDFYAGGPIKISQQNIEAHTKLLAENLGIETDSLLFMSTRVQHHVFFEKLVDSIGRSGTINPQVLNRSGIPLTGWKVTAGTLITDFVPLQNENSVYQQSGKFQIEYDDDYRVRSFQAKDGSSAFIQLQPGADGLRSVFTSFLGYDPNRYTTSLPVIPSDVQYVDAQAPVAEDQNQTVTWHKTSETARGPISIEVVIRPVIKEFRTAYGVELTEGIQIHRVSTSYHELDVPNETFFGLNTETVLFFVAVLILLLVVTVTGFKFIYNGEVIWVRGLVVFVVLLSIMVGWRVLVFQQTYYRFIDPGIQWIDVVSGFIVSFFLSLYGSLSYMAWESLARRHKDIQVNLMDAIWSGNIFKKKFGESVLSGYGIAGMALAGFSVAAYYLQVVFFHTDGQFGFIEVTSVLPVLSTTMSAFTGTWLIIFGHFGVLLTLFKRFTKNGLLFIILAVPLLTFLLLVIGRSVATTGTITQDYIMLLGMMLPLVIGARYFGIISVLTSWWAVFMILRLGVYLGSPDTSIALSGWLLVAVTATPLIIGFILYWFGEDLDTMRLTEYEERSMKQMRIEKEFQIAKDSQFALMPKSAPAIDGIDVKGFFIPSFEVGGDFFDYQLVKFADKEELVVSIVDVSGKAIKAAFTAIFTSGLLTSRLNSESPAMVLTDINRIIHQKTDKQTFITCLLMRYTPTDRKLTYVNAGHCQPILKRENQVEFLKAEDPRFPLGGFPEVTFCDTTITLKKGDTLVLYSDGLPESKNKKGALYGYNELKNLIQTIDCVTLRAEEICDIIKNTILRYSEYDLSDDMTVVVVKITK